MAAAADDLHAALPVEEVKAQALEWVNQQEIKNDNTQKEIAALWDNVPANLPARIVFNKLIDTFGLANADTQKLVNACRSFEAPLVPPDATAILENDKASPFYLANMRLFFGRYLARQKMYDEAWNIFEPLQAANVVDPAACLFWKAVCQHQLLMKDEALATLRELLENTQDVPVRYSSTATLMKHELEHLKEKTLDEIARKMKDSQRRLELARGGQRVQKVQREIIADLDEIIKKQEQQQGGGGGGGDGKDSGKSKGNKSSSPANESRVKGATGPGEVDEKKFRKQGGWGALPKKQIDRGKSMINKNFPAHYREAVKQYFKKLAGRRAKPER